MPIRWNKLLIVLFFLVVNVSFSQEKNPTVYPYGGVPDSSLFQQWLFRIPSYDDIPDTNWLKKVSIIFKIANFAGANFQTTAYFGGSLFFCDANFYRANFHDDADFMMAYFEDQADFKNTKFHNFTYFFGAKFFAEANFVGAQFDSLPDFERSYIGDEFHIGSKEDQKFDFTRTNFSPQAKLILCELTEINIQTEKIKYISLSKTLTYSLKRLIIDHLKEKSFPDNSKAKFELEYIFEKSTLYQEKRDLLISDGSGYVESSYYISENEWYYFWKWPKWFITTLYYITMGMGYRPFRLAWWVLGFIILFTFVYYLWMPGQINTYIAKGDERKTTSGSRRKRKRRTAHPHFTDTILNCFYFSSMMFFTFRLKRDILTFFSTKEKRVVVGEWFIGLIIYISFLTLSKSGSILHTLKSLFLG